MLRTRRVVRSDDNNQGDERNNSGVQTDEHGIVSTTRPIESSAVRDLISVDHQRSLAEGSGGAGPSNGSVGLIDLLRNINGHLTALEELSNSVDALTNALEGINHDQKRPAPKEVLDSLVSLPVTEEMCTPDHPGCSICCAPFKMPGSIPSKCPSIDEKIVDKNEKADKKSDESGTLSEGEIAQDKNLTNANNNLLAVVDNNKKDGDIVSENTNNTSKNQEFYIQLPHCGHQFHSDCVRHWLETFASTCPICRHDLASHGNNSSGENSENMNNQNNNNNNFALTNLGVEGENSSDIANNNPFSIGNININNQLQYLTNAGDGLLNTVNSSQNSGLSLLAAVDTNIRLDGTVNVGARAEESIESEIDGIVNNIPNNGGNQGQNNNNASSNSATGGDATARNERIAARMRRMIADILV